MSELDRYRGSSVRASKALAKVESGALVRRGEIEAAADIQAVKANGISFVAATAMNATAMLSQLELQHGAVCPEARGRLAMVGDTAALAMAQVVADTARAVNR